MAIISSKDISEALNFNRFGYFGQVLGNVVLQLTKLNKLNDIYDKYRALDGVEFIDAILLEVGAEFQIPEKDFKRIPKEGRLLSQFLTIHLVRLMALFYLK